MLKRVFKKRIQTSVVTPVVNGWTLSRQRGRDLHPGVFVEAICEHGVGHHNGIHGCDGCCRNMPKEMLDVVTKDK